MKEGGREGGKEKGTVAVSDVSKAYKREIYGEQLQKLLFSSHEFGSEFVNLFSQLKSAEKEKNTLLHFNLFLITYTMYMYILVHELIHVHVHAIAKMQWLVVHVYICIYRAV